MMIKKTFSWDNTQPLLGFDLVLIQGDAGTGTAFTAKKLLSHGFYWFYESDLFSDEDYATVLKDQLKALKNKNGKICIVCNRLKSHLIITDLENYYSNKIVISFAVHEKVKIPVKEYLILQ